MSNRKFLFLSAFFLAANGRGKVLLLDFKEISGCIWQKKCCLCWSSGGANVKVQIPGENWKAVLSQGSLMDKARAAKKLARIQSLSSFSSCAAVLSLQTPVLNCRIPEDIRHS
jgi:hypothetical protein